MMRATLFLSLVVLLLVGGSSGFGQTFDAQFVVMLNDGVNYDVKVQIKANVSTFALGTSNFIFSFDGTAVSAPTLQTAHNFSGSAYQTMLLSGSGNSRSISIELNTAPGTTVTTGYMDVATIRFTVTTPAGGSNLQWNGGASVVYKDDETTVVGAGTLNNLNTQPLPVQLASFSAGMSQQGSHVMLKWSTASETNNYGFEVQKAATDDAATYENIANSFVAGHGTTIEPHVYAFTDVTATQGASYYRLKQIDLDGTVHYSDGVRPTGVTGVADRPFPTAYSLDQNYPNPFNPSTAIEFALPRETRVTLEVYNLLGQRVALLVDDVRPAGYYSQRFDGSSFGSGIYFYRLSAGEVSFLKKMLLVK